MGFFRRHMKWRRMIITCGCEFKSDWFILSTVTCKCLNTHTQPGVCLLNLVSLGCCWLLYHISITCDLNRGVYTFTLPALTFYPFLGAVPEPMLLQSMLMQQPSEFLCKSYLISTWNVTNNSFIFVTLYHTHNSETSFRLTINQTKSHHTLSWLCFRLINISNSSVEISQVSVSVTDTMAYLPFSFLRREMNFLGGMTPTFFFWVAMLWKRSAKQVSRFSFFFCCAL